MTQRKRKVVESSSDPDPTGDGDGEFSMSLRPRVKIVRKCARPMKKKMKPSVQKSSDMTDEEWTDEQSADEQPKEKQSADDQLMNDEPAREQLMDKQLEVSTEENVPAKTSPVKKMVGRKPFLNKEKVAKRFVRELEEVPLDFDELRDRSTPSLGAVTQRWIDEIDFIKSKCKTMQGPLIKRMTERTMALIKLVQLLAERVQDNGDISYLKKQNVVMSTRVDIYEKEVASLKNEVKELTELIGELQQKAIKAVKEKEIAEASRKYLLKSKQDRATSPMPQIIESPSVNIYSTCNKCSENIYHKDEPPLPRRERRVRSERSKKNEPMEFMMEAEKERKEVRKSKKVQEEEKYSYLKNDENPSMSGSSLKKSYAGVPEMMVPLEFTDESGKREMKELIEEKKKELIEVDDNKLSDNTYLKKEEFPVLRPSLKSSCFRN